MYRILLVLALLFSTMSSQAILPDGSVAEDFTVTDLDGNTHTLYDYLDNGVMVVLDLFATWCVPCWNYHQSHALENLYNQYGPDGTGEIMVFSIEVDMGTAEDCITGNCGNTVGDWTAGISYPIVHMSDPSVGNDYNVTYYPTIYTICPDGLVYESGQVSTNQHSRWLNSCRFEAVLNGVTGVDCFEDHDGSIDTDYIEGNGGVAYQWSNGSSTQDLTELDAGTYSVTMTEGFGRKAFLTDIIVDGPIEEVEVSVTDYGDIDCNGNANGFVNTDVFGGMGGYTFQWDHGPTTQNIQDLSGGSYHLVVTDQNGCSKEVTQDVFEPDQVTIALSAQDEACDQQNGIIFADSDGGVGTHMYDYGSGAQDDGTFIGLSSGFYDVTVTDGNLCSAQENIFLANLPAPFGDAGPDKTLGCATSQVQLEGDADQGANIVYQWTTNGGNIVDGENTLTPTVDEAGIYDLEVTDNATGCVSMDFVVVTPDPNQPVADAGGDKMLSCTTSSVVLDGSNSSTGDNYTYQWTTPDGNIVEGGNTPTATVDAGGTYTLQVTENGSGCTSVSSALVTADIDQPNADIADHGDLDCNITQMQLDGSNSDQGANITYQWTTTDGNIVSGGNTPTPTVDAGGTYTLEVTNTSNGCFEALSTEVEQDIAAPDAEAGDGGQLTCIVNQMNLDGSNSSSGDNISYTWTTPDGNIVEGSDSQNPLVNAAGTYVLVVNNSVNGCSMSDQVVVSVDTEAPIVDAGPSKMIDCDNLVIALEGSQTSNGDDGVIVWSTADGNIVEGADGATPTVNAAGTYTMMVTDASNGCVASDAVVVEADADLPSADAGENKVLTCMIDQVTLDGSNSASGDNISYQWSSQDGNIVEGGDQPTALVDAVGTYVLEVTNTDNNCTATSVVEVTAFINEAVADYDYQTNDLEVVFENMSMGQGAMVSWDMGNGDVIDGDVSSYTFAEAGEYNVCLTVTTECGSNTSCQLVQVSPGTVLFETNIKHVSCFGGNDGFIALEVTSGNEPHVFSWSNGSEISTIDNLTAGEYTVVISDSEGNSAEETFMIIEPDDIVMVNSDIVDQMDTELGSISIELEGGTGDYTYMWSNGAETKDIDGLEEGEYTLVVTDENNCEKTFGPFEVRNVTGVNDIESLNRFDIYPNPAYGDAQMSLSFDRSMSIEVRAFTLNGQLISRQQMTTEDVTINLGDMVSETGLYIIEVVTVEGTATKKYLKF